MKRMLIGVALVVVLGVIVRAESGGGSLPPPESTSSEGVAPAATGLKPFRDHIWVFALQNGSPVRSMPFLFVEGAGKKLVQTQTDSMGKIDFRVDQAGKVYHILLIDGRYAFREITNAKGGDAYQVNIVDAPPGTGVIVVRDKTKEIRLPGADKVTFGRYSGGKDGSGTTLVSAKKVFRLPSWNPGNEATWIPLSLGQSVHIVDGLDRYEVKWFPLAPGQNFILRYKPLE